MSSVHLCMASVDCIFAGVSFMNMLISTAYYPAHMANQWDALEQDWAGAWLRVLYGASPHQPPCSQPRRPLTFLSHHNKKCENQCLRSQLTVTLCGRLVAVLYRQGLPGEALHSPRPGGFGGSSADGAFVQGLLVW